MRADVSADVGSDSKVLKLCSPPDLWIQHQYHCRWDSIENLNEYIPLGTVVWYIRG